MRRAREKREAGRKRRGAARALALALVLGAAGSVLHAPALYAGENAAVSADAASQAAVSQTMENQESAAVEPVSSAVYPRGSYIVGRDLPAGEYLIYTEDTSENNAYSSCALTLYRDEDDERKIGAFRFQNHGLITLYNGQHLILENGFATLAGESSIVREPVVAAAGAPDGGEGQTGNSQPAEGTFPGKPAGTYKAGRDIEPGTYRITPLTADGGHYALYNDVRYYYDYIDEYKTFFEPVTVTVGEGQYLELMDAASVEKM